LLEVKDQRTKTQVIYDKLFEVEESLITVLNEVDESNYQETRSIIDQVIDLRKKIIEGGKES